MGLRSVKSTLKSPDYDCGVPILVEERQLVRSKGCSVRCAEFNIEAIIQTDVHQWELRSMERGNSSAQ